MTRNIHVPNAHPDYREYDFTNKYFYQTVVDEYMIKKNLVVILFI